MKRLIIVVLAVGVISALFGALALNGDDASAAKEKSPVVGNWEAIDVFDGSYMQMSINPGLRVMLFDDWASACPDPAESAIMKGKGEMVDPLILEGEGEVRCKASHVRWDVPFRFDSIAPDLLTDEWGNLWTRVP